MMLVLALRTDAERVYQRARRQFSDEEIAEAFAATRGLTMPSQLRRMLRQQGRDLHAEFLALLPYRLPPMRIQRWSWRRVVLTDRHPVRRVLARRLIARQPARGSRCEARPAPAARPAGSSAGGCSPGAPATRPRSPRSRLRSAGDDGADNGVDPDGPVGADGDLGALHPRPRCRWAGASTTWTPATASPGSGWTPTGTASRRSRSGSSSPATRPGPPRSPATARACAAASGSTGSAPAYAGERYYVFDGGCITVVFSPGRRQPRRGAGARHPGGRRGQPRPTCAAQVHEESDGRLSLDPAPAEGG